MVFEELKLELENRPNKFIYSDGTLVIRKISKAYLFFWEVTVLCFLFYNYYKTDLWNTVFDPFYVL